MDDKPKPNFFSHVFDFEKDSRSEMLNIAQYSVIAAVFVVLLNKAFDSYMPDNDPTKTAVALSFEVLLQCVLLFLGIVFIHRIISYIPTISGVVYATRASEEKSAFWWTKCRVRRKSRPRRPNNNSSSSNNNNPACSLTA